MLVSLRSVRGVQWAKVGRISHLRCLCSVSLFVLQAPHIQLHRWETLQDSEWQIRWAPSWSVQVCSDRAVTLRDRQTLSAWLLQVMVEGLQYLQFTLMLRLYDFRVSGRLKFRASPDLSTIALSFVTLPTLRLKTQCQVSWGTVALPLQTYIETVVQDEFQRWIRDNVIAPHELMLNPSSFQPKTGLSDADVQKAIRAVALARELSQARAPG